MSDFRERAFSFFMIVGTMKGWASMTYLLRADHMDHTVRGKVQTFLICVAGAYSHFSIAHFGHDSTRHLSYRVMLTGALRIMVNNSF